MKSLKITLCGLALLALSNKVAAQDTTQVNASATGTPAVQRLPAVWIFGIHGVVVDDDGQYTKNLFAASKSWNLLPYPTRISAERTLNEFHDAWRVEAAFAYSQYKPGKIVNDEAVLGTHPFIAFDLNAKYDLNDLFGETSVFDPYTVSGLGFTHRSALRVEKNTPTLNLGLGFNVWIYKGWGINLQTTAKIKIYNKSSNYLMHTAGVVYRLNFLTKNSTGNGVESAIRQQM